MRFLMVLVMALGLAACGSNESEIRIGQPSAKVYSALSQSSIAEVAMLMPGLAVQRSNPSQNEILYTAVGDDGNATVRFTLESVDGDTATIVRTTVDAPEITAKIGGEMKVLSEARVAMGMQRALRSFSRDGDAGKVRTELNGVLAALAISTNRDARELVLGGDKEAALERLLANIDLESMSEGDPGWGNGDFDSERSASADTDAPEDVSEAAASADNDTAADADWGG